METVMKKAFNPDTREYYMIEMPVPAIVRQGILELDNLSNGISIKDASVALAERFELSNEQRNARNSSNLNLFRHNVVSPQFKWLLERDKLEQPGGPRTAYFLAGSSSDSPDSTLRETSPEPEWTSSPESVKRTAMNPDTKEEYQVTLPSTPVVKKVLLGFDYPASGIRIKDIAEVLADQLELTDDQRNARYKYGLVWRFYVNITANDLVNSGQLLRLKRGWITNPEQPDVETPEDADGDSPFSDRDTSSPEVVIEQNYREHQDRLKEELLQNIMDNPPDFFEALVVELLVKMGYGRSHEDVELTGGSGDGGIDGIIYEDPLKLDAVYVQAKRFKDTNVGSPDIINFTGALANKGASKGVFITTSCFTKNAKASANENPNFKIVLIDGKELLELMIEHNVGISLGKFYQLKEVDMNYFSIDDAVDAD